VIDVVVVLNVEDAETVKLRTGDVIKFSERPEVVTLLFNRVTKEVSNDFDVSDEALNVVTASPVYAYTQSEPQSRSNYVGFA